MPRVCVCRLQGCAACRTVISGAGTFGSFAAAAASIRAWRGGGSRVLPSREGRSSSRRLALGAAIRVRICRPARKSATRALAAPASLRHAARAPRCARQVAVAAGAWNKRRCAARKAAVGRGVVAVSSERLKVDGGGGEPGAAHRSSSAGQRAELQNKWVRRA